MTENRGFKFPKEERLKSKRMIEELFEKGSSIYLYPFRILYLKGPRLTSTGLPQIVITIPKRIFKKSVDRNRIRRQIREAYRLSRNDYFLPENDENPSVLAIIYTAKEKVPFSKIQEKLNSVLNRFKISEK